MINTTSSLLEDAFMLLLCYHFQLSVLKTKGFYFYGNQDMFFHYSLLNKKALKLFFLIINYIINVFTVTFDELLINC